ncbi:MAG TPA: TOBE domain-containing protein, partial [Verrucomicrobiae bacterium]|nr:TOBE domain-containing protein [Verrucomicrobiae bacterium]
KVLLFDEPLSNLDPSMRSQLRLEISRLHRRIAATVLYVTHDQMEAMTLGNRVAVMCAGSLQQIDRPMALYQHPATTFVAEFIGSPPMNLIPGTIDRVNGGHWFQQSVSTNKSEADALRLLLPAQLGDRLQGHIGKPISLGLRPEQIAPADASAALPSRQTVQLVVELIEPTGPDTFFHARCGGRTLVGRAHGSFSPRLGQEFAVAIDLSRLHLFDGTSGQTILCGS